MDNACDTCRDPGYCCRNFSLNTIFPADMPRSEVDQHIAEGTDPWRKPGEREVQAEATPFFHASRVTGRYAYRGQRKPHGVKWGFDCERLGEDGRCMQYEDRPQVCRGYEPKTDLLCIEFEGSYKGYLKLYGERGRDGDE